MGKRPGFRSWGEPFFGFPLTLCGLSSGKKLADGNPEGFSPVFVKEVTKMSLHTNAPRMRKGTGQKICRGFYGANGHPAGRKRTNAGDIARTKRKAITPQKIGSSR